MKRTIVDFELISHGFEHPDYFQGCGVMCTPFASVVTGCGNTEKEAFEDAIEQIACEGIEGFEAIKEEANSEGLGETIQDQGPDAKEYDQNYFYFSIRYNTEAQ